MKLEISNIYYSNKNKYIVATLSGELFALLNGTHFDYYHKRNKYVDLK
jgi:hypothetical protein